MKNKARKAKKKIQWGQMVMMLIFMLIGGICGVLIISYFGDEIADMRFGSYMLRFALLILLMYLIMILQIALHEAGHLIFGLLTGYGFSSYRLGSFMLLKDGDKLRLRRLSLAGTGGQCLMVPPDMENGTMPYVLYNLGGCILNALSALAALTVFLLCREGHPLAALAAAMTALFGFAYALTNGIPLNMGGVDNDGRNALHMGKTPGALRAFWIQMKINQLSSEGVRLRDMPEDWFTVPQAEELNNSIASSVGVFTCNRLMDMHRFDEADALMKQLMAGKSAIPGVYLSLMSCDRIFCLIHAGAAEDEIKALLTKPLKQFMKSMKNYPSVIRTEYALALWSKDEKKAAKVKKTFFLCEKRHPYPVEVEGEKELISLLDGKFNA